MIDDLLGMLLLLAPAGIANTAPVWFAKLPYIKHWNTPLDFGKSWRGIRIFGQNKTWRGLLSGALVGALIGLIQWFFIDQSQWLADIDLLQGEMNIVLFGAITGLFALIGDAVESFFKRRAGVRPGKPWVPFDQTDYILGAYVFIGLTLDLTPTQYVLGLLSYTLFHPIVSYAGYLLKIKKDPF
ncbi:MAG: CDP-archaeol synthase [Patescibacteria group bacterium]